MSILETPATEAGSTAAAAAPWAHARVLVIDDEEMVGNTLSALLKADGFDAVAARSGKEGVELMRGQPFEAAIVDLVMPGMDGIKTLSALKEVDPDVEVLILTGNVTVNSTIAALRQGACDFLQKPIGITQLGPAVRRALEKRRGEIARREARSRAVIETAREAIVLFDRQGVVREFNPVAEQIFGRSRAQVLGKNLAEFAIPTKFVEVFQGHLETAYRLGKDPLHGCVEVSALRANGEEFPFEISTAVIDTPQGKLLSTFGRDVSERKRVMEALWASEAKLQAIFNGVKIGILVIDPETHRIEDANPVALDLVGASRERVVGSVCHKFICPADLGRCPVTDLGQNVDESERILLTATGENRSIIKTVRPVVIAGRKLLLESFVDITARKRAEQALREAEEQFHSLFSSIPLPTLLFDAETLQYLEVNAAAVSSSGYSRDELLHMRVMDLAPSENAAGIISQIQALQPQSLVRSEGRYRLKDGRLADVESDLCILEFRGRRAVLSVSQDVTARKRAEEALRESEDRYRDLVENSFVLIGTHDAQGRLLSANRALANLLEVSGAGEARGHSLTEYVPPDLMPQFDEYLKAILRKGHAEGVMVIAAPSGKIKLVEYQNTLRLQDSREPIVRCIGHDVTERVQAEKAQALLASVVESSQDAIISVTLEGTIVSWNRGAEDLYGYRAEEALGKPNSILAPPDRREELAGLLENSRRGRKTSSYETVRVCKDGRRVDVSLTISPILDARGEITGSASIGRDITARKRAEDQSRLQTAALESAANGIVITDHHGRIIWVNPAFTRLTGYSAPEAIGQNPRVLRSGEHDKGFYQKLWNTVLSGKVWHGEIVNRRKDGALYPEEMTITPVRDGKGEVAHFIAIKQDITERKRAEKALEERTVYLNTLFEISPMGIVVLNTEGTIQMSNSAFEKLFLYSRGEITSARLDDFLVPPELAAEAKTLTNWCLSGASASASSRRRRKDGSLVDVDIFGVPLVIEGELRGYLALYQNITERKRAEADLVQYAEDLEVAKAAQEEHAEELGRLVEELARERDLLGTLMDNLPDYIYYKDRQSRFLRTNPVNARTLGVSDPQQAVGKTDFDFYPEADAQSFFRDDQRVIESGQPLIGRIERVRQPDGQYRWFSTSKVPIRDNQGRVTGLVGIGRDITEHMQAEETLRASEERYRELFENASDIVYTTGLDTHLTSLNRVGQAILGYSAEEAAQLDLKQLVLPKHWEQMKVSRERMLAGESDMTIEVDVSTKDGRPMTLEVKPRLIYRAGKPVGVQGIARDITGRDEAELELRHAQKLESVGRLASGIAHEINTPIQFVGDNTRFLQDSFVGLQSLLTQYQELRDAAASGALSPNMLAKVRKAEEAADCDYLLEEIPKALAQTLEGVTRVATIVRAMKEFAHPEGKEMAAADINRALQSTLTVARNELKYIADVETEFGELPLVVCNVGDLNQVFLNLLVNAAHAIGEKVGKSGQKGNIRVRTVAEGGTVLVTVSDTGCGIPEANRARVFDPFFTTKEVGRGTGQGLAIARSVVVDRHKGALTFESEEGKGTTFYVRLPVDCGDCSKDRRLP